MSVFFLTGYSVYHFVLSLSFCLFVFLCVFPSVFYLAMPCYLLSLWLCICVSFYLSFFCVHLSFCLFHLYGCMSVYFSLFYFCQSVSVPFISMSVCLSAGSGDGPGQAPVLQPGHPVWAPHDLSPVPGTGAPVCVPGRHHPRHPKNGGRHVSQCKGLN